MRTFATYVAALGGLAFLIAVAPFAGTVAWGGPALSLGMTSTPAPEAAAADDDEPKSALPKVGDPAPSFDLPAGTGGRVKLDDYRGKTVVVYFYPKADTPGCTTQACGFRDSADEYEKAGVSVVGISPDPVEDVRKFAEKFDVNFPLLADADRSVCGRYGVLRERTVDGKTYTGAARTTFVVGPDGKVTHVFENVKVDGHEKQVLDAIRHSQSRP